ncbi:hypothetical protein [Streptomyces sp. NPDC054786]
MADRSDTVRDQRSHAPAWRRAAASAAAALSLALAASGCGGPEVNYAIPSNICGLSVGRDLLQPFFPPGDRVEFDGDAFDGRKAKSFCQYYVDGNTALAVDGRRSSQDETAALLAKRYADPAHLKSWAQSGGRIAGYAGTVYGTATCSGNPSDSDGQPARSYSLEISVNHYTNTKTVRPELAKLMSALLPQAARARGCQ